MKQLRICKVREVKSPAKANITDAGFDFFVPDSFEHHYDVLPNTSVMVPSGLLIDVPKGWALVFFNKSGIASKTGQLVGAQVVDAGYQGEVFLNVHNVSTKQATIIPGMKLVQGLLLPVPEFEVVEFKDKDLMFMELSSRGTGGFGSTEDRAIADRVFH